MVWSHVMGIAVAQTSFEGTWALATDPKIMNVAKQQMVKTRMVLDM